MDLSAGAFKDAQVIEASKKFVCIFVECEWELTKNTDLIEKFRIQAYPTILFCDPAGNQEGILAGSIETASILSKMETIARGYGPCETLEKAIEKAKEDKKPVLYLFVKPNVANALETALRDASLSDLVKQFVLARSVITKDNADAKTLSIIDGSLLVFDPALKEPILKLTGKKNIKEIRKELEAALKKFQKDAGEKP
jgi:hypothetical protein